MDQGRQDSDGQQDSGHQYRHESLSGPNHHGQQSTAGEPGRTGLRHLEVYGVYIQVQNILRVILQSWVLQEYQQITRV